MTAGDQDSRTGCGAGEFVRRVPEGTVPLLAVEGTARECGRQYADMVLAHHPGYRRYLDPACRWHATMPARVRELFEARIPHLLDVYSGMAEVAGPAPAGPRSAISASGCTAFGVAAAATLDGQPLSGQTKDTNIASASRYIALRMRFLSAPALLVLAYPGEVLGYGMWSTGMSVFRNSLYSTAGGRGGLTMEQWGLLALGSQTVHEAVELAETHGLSGAGNCLISDAAGESLSVEYNEGGVSIVPAKEGIATHANHPEGGRTAAFEHYADAAERRNSRYRMHGLWTSLDAERGRLSVQKAFMLLADHTRFPLGICRHAVGGDPDVCTTAAVVAEPTRGRLHLVRGNPCCNWPVTYEI